jgi:hypothetical protein
VDEHRPLDVGEVLERPDQGLEVVTGDGADVGVPELLEEEAGDDEPLRQFLGLLRDARQERAVRHRFQERLDPLAERGVELPGHDPVEVPRNCADVLGDRPLVVVEDDDEIPLLVPRLVQPLEGETGGEGAVPDDGDDPVLPLPQVPGDGHPEGRGDRRAGVPGAEGVAGAL